jgi:hypothetical protein
MNPDNIILPPKPEQDQDEQFEPIPPDWRDVAAQDAGVPRWGEI